jgi:hypothetical protein
VERLLSSVLLLLLAGTFKTANAEPTYPSDMDAGKLAKWLREATNITPEEVIAVSASAATAIVSRSATNGHNQTVLLRAQSLTAEATSPPLI